MATRRTHRNVWRGRGEYVGETRANTLFAKDPGAPLDAEERMRLLKHTASEDVTKLPTGRAWLGFKEYPDSVIDFED